MMYVLNQCILRIYNNKANFILLNEQKHIYVEVNALQSQHDRVVEVLPVRRVVACTFPSNGEKWEYSK